MVHIVFFSIRKVFIEEYIIVLITKLLNLVLSISLSCLSVI
jgi:hypothetical protein